jgi:hypothetical protein
VARVRTKATQEGAEYISEWLCEYKERMRPKIEAEIRELRSKLINRERDYMEIYGKEFGEIGQE